ncbi:hypothetical protein Q5752_003609 [Cryptotrichosporon argae]
MKLLALCAALPFLSGAWGWGAAGHEMIATIAQIHLHPAVRAQLCDILPAEARCHLAPIAAWADQVRGRYPQTGGMHYVNPKLDHPGDHCEFGEHGWINEDVNVLTAIMNKTQAVMDGEGDIPLRFLVHFVGDLHQPLHLTGRDKGGNGAMFRFEGRLRNLHSVWDSGLITKNIRELSNYTTPVPSKQVESALLGAIFDPYVRFIVWEGIREWWRDSLAEWVSCPAAGDPYPHSSNTPALAPTPPSIWQETWDTLVGWLPVLGTLDIPYVPQSTAGFADKLLAYHPSKVAAGEAGEHVVSAQAAHAELGFPACPYTWSLPLHEINCALAWPAEYTGEPPLIELDTDAYVGRIGREKIVEKLLAMAGIRLAKVLNEALGGKDLQGLVNGLYMDY